MTRYVGPKTDAAHLATQGDLGGGGAMPRCKAVRASVQSIPNDAWTPIAFPGEEYDSDGMHSTSSNTHQINIPTGGLWLVTAQVMFAASTAGSYRAIRIVDEGGGILVTSDASSHAVARRIHCSVQLEKSSGWVAVEAYQNSGGALNAAPTGRSPFLAVARIG